MWFLDYLKSSIGKKQTMGLAGLGLVGFLAGHLAGNLQLLNPDAAAAQAAYNAYTKFLTGMKPMIWFVEAGLVGIFLYHAALATKLKLENLKARGKSRYAVNAHVGSATPASYTMYVTGSAILLFAVLHLAVFKFGTHYLYVDAKGDLIRDMWLTTVLFFGNPVYMGLYVLALLAIGAHLFHALPSLFRTFGLEHPKWTPIFTAAGMLAAAAISAGFVGTAVGTFALTKTNATQAQIQKAQAAQTVLQAKLAK